MSSFSSSIPKHDHVFLSADFIAINKTFFLKMKILPQANEAEIESAK